MADGRAKRAKNYEGQFHGCSGHSCLVYVLVTGATHPNRSHRPLKFQRHASNVRTWAPLLCNGDPYIPRWTERVSIVVEEARSRGGGLGSAIEAVSCVQPAVTIFQSPFRAAGVLDSGPISWRCNATCDYQRVPLFPDLKPNSAFTISLAADTLPYLHGWT
ncbi:hypothetical protein KM043_004960 [Ampulex compressa]|nr:hypothetical protein KM043_004960 [Ampulex compressa]